ncbi:MAG: hypothetical protein V5A79_02790, partial [Candidatus Bipolaricaulota bacterium]
SGESCEIISPQPGSLLVGMKIPLTKIKGNLIKVDSIIISAVVSVGTADISTPIAEKQKLARIIPNTRVKKFKGTMPKIPATAKMETAEMEKARAIEPMISPKSISVTLIGLDTSLSRVFVLVSQGAITGLIDVEVNQMAIPESPAINEMGGISLPTKKAKKKKKGRSIPKITTGPFP